MIVPGPRPEHPVAGLDLGALEQFDVRHDPVPVALGLGRGEDHGLKRDRSTCC